MLRAEDRAEDAGGRTGDIFTSQDKELGSINKDADKQIAAIEKTRQQSVKGELDAHSSALGEMQDAE
jgi:hypothetical protein